MTEKTLQERARELAEKKAMATFHPASEIDREDEFLLLKRADRLAALEAALEAALADARRRSPQARAALKGEQNVR